MKNILAPTLRCFWPTAFLLAAGCGKSNAFNDKVEGIVQMNGAPLSNVMVEFLPDADPSAGAPTATGYTDGNGHFQLTHDKNQPGASIGKHHVIIVQGRSGGQSNDRDALAVAPTGPPLPLVYSIAARTPLQVDVTATQHSYDLIVSSQSITGGGGRGRDD